MPHPSTDADPHASAVSVSAYVSDKPAHAARPPRSALKSVCLVAACTLANLINVRSLQFVLARASLASPHLPAALR